jgi:predicted Rossmann-fold nucleotide-binding protein
LVNCEGYFDLLIGFLDRAVTERFLRPEHRAMVLVEAGAAVLLERFAQFEPPRLEKWIDRGET